MKPMDVPVALPAVMIATQVPTIPANPVWDVFNRKVVLNIHQWVSMGYMGMVFVSLGAKVFRSKHKKRRVAVVLQRVENAQQQQWFKSHGKQDAAAQRMLLGSDIHMCFVAHHTPMIPCDVVSETLCSWTLILQTATTRESTYANRHSQ